MAIYKIKHRQAFAQIVCDGDYQCNKDAFFKSLAQYPEAYPNWKELPSEDGKFVFEVAEIVNAKDALGAKDLAYKSMKTLAGICEIHDKDDAVVVDRDTMKNFVNSKK